MGLNLAPLPSYEAIVFIGLPMKETSAVDWTKAIQTAIKEEYSKEDVATHTEAIQKVQTMRKELKGLTTKNGELFLQNHIFQYMGLVQKMASRFPFGSSAMKIKFTWYDILTKESASLPNPTFEAMAIAHLGGSYLTQLAAEQPPTPEGTKAAYRQYEAAAGIFAHIENKMLPHMTEVTTPDLSRGGLQFAQAFCLAEAQRCSFLRALEEPATAGKNKLLSKFAMECWKMYHEALSKLNEISQDGKGAIQLASYITVLAAHMKARAFGMVAEEHHKECNIGLELGYLQSAKGLLQQATKMNLTSPQHQKKLQEMIKSLEGKLQSQYNVAIDENNKVYHARIPKDLPEVPALGKTFAKVTEFNTNFLETLKDPFKDLVPKRIIEMVEKFTADVAAMVSQQYQATMSSREAVRQAESANVSGIGAILEAQRSGQLPKALQTKVIALQNEAGANSSGTYLLELARSAASQVSGAQEVIQQAEKKLCDDNLKEEEALTKHGALAESAEQQEEVESLLQAISDVKRKLTVHQEQDNALIARITKAQDQLDRIDIPVEDVNNALSQCEEVEEAGQAVSKDVEEMQQVINMLDELDAVQQVTFNEFRQQPDAEQITQLLLPLSTDEEREQALEDAKVPWLAHREELQSSIHKANRLVRQLQVLADRIHEKGAKVNPMAERVINRLSAACRLFEELKDAIARQRFEGSNLVNVCVNIRDKVTQCVVYRQRDRDDRVQEAILQKQLEEKTRKLEEAQMEMERCSEEAKRASEERKKRIAQHLAMQEVMGQQQPAQPAPQQAGQYGGYSSHPTPHSPQPQQAASPQSQPSQGSNVPSVPSFTSQQPSQPSYQSSPQYHPQQQPPAQHQQYQPQQYQPQQGYQQYQQQQQKPQQQYQQQQSYQPQYQQYPQQQGQPPPQQQQPQYGQQPYSQSPPQQQYGQYGQPPPPPPPNPP
eukprot:Sspe_Gene.24626::Locus_9793_Transcript_1_1_Confidence_1.000_Length_2885::g.24626::m.24626/K12200/PDCD6IP, ALIX, RIM20; programmed cell death 6-interacting protein